VLVLADEPSGGNKGGPAEPVTLDAALYETARQKGLRLFLEFPGSLPGLRVEPLREARWERAVVASDAFGQGLARLRLLALHAYRYVPVTLPTAGSGHPAKGTLRAHLVLARVAGYDTAVFGLPKETFPLLFELPADPDRPEMLVAAAPLSSFVTSRYAPTEAWREVWRFVFRWLQPEASLPALQWTPTVRPTYGKDSPLPRDAELRALRKGIAWYSKARVLIDPSWPDVYGTQAKEWTDRIGPPPSRRWRVGDGSLGVLEGFDSVIAADGSQRARWWRRADCIAETAGVMALAGRALHRVPLQRVGGNLGDYLLTRSILSQGERAAPSHPSYGLLGWNDVPHYFGEMDGFGVYYGDDIARSMLGVMAAAGGLNTPQWDERLARCLLASLRLSSVNGFQPTRIDEAPLEARGWRSYWGSDLVQYSPHYQAYLWACYLWAYRHTGFRPFLDRAEKGIRMMVAAYPDRWEWNGSMQIERAKMVLPLAWLVRVRDTPEHRAWLRSIVEPLLARQDATGSIHEELGPPGHPMTAAPASNEAYGTAEAPLIQTNGDPAGDLLYTQNFALLGLHEAAAATGDAYYRQAEDRLARFLCRVQVRSEAHPELDGGWFRAFDSRRWEYWASGADSGWGAWCLESGWSQSWITMVLSLRHLKTSLWALTEGSRIGSVFDACRRQMLPEAG
jgi:hypothetical protein